MEYCLSVLLMLGLLMGTTPAALLAKTSSETATASASVASGASGFEKLKTLVGEWEGKSPDGQLAKVTYELISGGTALMETVTEGVGGGMVSIYHANGDKLLMTHYCSMGNQPRLQASVPAGEVQRLDFTFVDGANITSHDGGHIHSLTIRFQDKDHFTQEWGHKDGGKEAQMKVTFTRKK